MFFYEFVCIFGPFIFFIYVCDYLLIFFWGIAGCFRLMNNKLSMACYIHWDSENIPLFLRLRKYVFCFLIFSILHAKYSFELMLTISHSLLKSLSCVLYYKKCVSHELYLSYACHWIMKYVVL